ncbi:MAG TPA: tol-pal system protein YbgF [Methylobacter sp.]|jgi:tol-pal system protein YbgF
MRALLISLLCVCSAVNAEPLPPVVDNSMYPVGEANAVKPPPTNALYEMMGRLEQLQAEVQQLTGKVEEQANLIAEMKKSQSTMYSDFDERMQSLEKKAEGVKPATAESSQTQEGTVASEAKVAEPPTAAPAAVPEIKQAPAQKPDAVQASGEASAPRTASTGDEKQQYQQAYEALRNGHTAQAIAEFNALLGKNPKGEYANNAQYWLGEAYRVNQDTDSARKAFSGVIENYPGSAKVPDAMLKLGTIEIEQKNPAKAREYLTRVTADFPGSTAARLAAKKLLLLEDVKQ